MRTAAEEARQCTEAGGGTYFRFFRIKFKRLQTGSRIFYIEDGHIRGFAFVTGIIHSKQLRCDVTGKRWGEGWYAIMPADSWKWIKPIARKGFMGHQAMIQIAKKVQVIGGWLDEKPN